MRIVALIVFVSLSLSACGRTQASSFEAKAAQTAHSVAQACWNTEFTKALNSALEHWQDTVALADSTPRANLPAIISQLQEIKREVAALDTPECGAALSAAVAGYMDAEIEVYMAFLRDASDGEMFLAHRHARYMSQVMSEETEALREDRLAKEIPTPSPDSVEVTYLVGGTATDIYAVFDNPDGSRQRLSGREPLIHEITLGLGGMARVHARRDSGGGDVYCVILMDGYQVVRRECKTSDRLCTVLCRFSLMPE